MTERTKYRMQAADALYVVALLCLVAATIFFARRAKVGVVDSGRVATEVGFEERLELDNLRLRNEAASKSQELLAEFQETRTAVQEEMAATGSEDEKAALRTDLAEKQRRLEGSLLQMRRDVIRQGQQQVAAFRSRLGPIISDIARKKRLDVVVDASSSAMLYCNRKVDMTAEVIDAAKKVFAGEMVEE